MSMRGAPARGAEVIIGTAIPGQSATTTVGNATVGVAPLVSAAPCDAVKADARITATAVRFADGRVVANYIFEQGYNPIGVMWVVYDNTPGSLWALYE